MTVRNSLLLAAFFVAACSVAVGQGSAAHGQSVVGKWNGRMDIKVSGMPPNMPADQKAALDKGLNDLRQTKLILELRQDKICSMTANGPLTKGPQVQSGTWSQNGAVVTLKLSNTRTHKSTTESGTLSADRKTLTISQPAPFGTAYFILKKA
jgi:hypothetical protein